MMGAGEIGKALWFQIMTVLGALTIMFYAGQITQFNLPAKTMRFGSQTIREKETTTSDRENVNKVISNKYHTESSPGYWNNSQRVYTNAISAIKNTNDTTYNQHMMGISDKNARKLILFWTKYTKNESSLWWRPLNGYASTLRLCEYKNCEFTADKTRLGEADMVLAKDNQMDYEGSHWPVKRSPNQLYVHFLGERPGKWHDYIKGYNGIINLTMNYRKSADISVPFQQLYTRATPIPGRYQLRIPLKNKTRMAVWPVSHCIADSNRQDYIKELSKYIDVDIYGRCGNFSCPKSDPYACYPQWEKTYKFYIAFENAICDDYITEKYYKPLKYELVPIILSGPRYNSDTPPHEAIDASNYASPQKLAKYLQFLAQNEDEYRKFFEWKQTHRFSKSTPSAICKICKAAHVHRNKPAHTDYYSWWFSGCDNGLVDRMKKYGKW